MARKAIFGVSDPTMSDTKQAVDPQKVARGLKFWMEEAEGLY